MGYAFVWIAWVIWVLLLLLRYGWCFLFGSGLSLDFWDASWDWFAWIWLFFFWNVRNLWFFYCCSWLKILFNFFVGVQLNHLEIIFNVWCFVGRLRWWLNDFNFHVTPSMARNLVTWCWNRSTNALFSLLLWYQSHFGRILALLLRQVFNLFFFFGAYLIWALAAFKVSTIWLSLAIIFFLLWLIFPWSTLSLLA